MFNAYFEIVGLPFYVAGCLCNCRFKTCVNLNTSSYFFIWYSVSDDSSIVIDKCKIVWAFFLGS